MKYIYIHIVLYDTYMVKKVLVKPMSHDCSRAEMAPLQSSMATENLKTWRL